MRQIALLAALLSLAAAPVASADAPSWSELPAYDAPGGGPAVCLRDAGAGRVTLLGDHDPRRTAIDLIEPSPGGAVRGGATAYRDLIGCPEVAPNDDAVPLLTAFQAQASARRWRFTRLAGPAGEPPVVLGAASGRMPLLRAAAAAPGGAAAIAWNELGEDRSGGLYVARRPSAGAPFGAPERLAGRLDDLRIGIDGRGRVHVAWSVGMALRVASAEPGRRFRSTLRSRRLAWDGEGIALAVARDGRALVAAPSESEALAWELQPGAATFAAVALPPIAGETLALALEPGGAAVLAGATPGGGSVAVARRVGGGRFAAAQRLSGPRLWGDDDGFAVMFFTEAQPGVPSDSSTGAIDVRLSATGEFVVAWKAVAGGGHAPSAYAARGTLADGVGAAARLGGACRPVTDVRPIALADGRLAVAWTDHGRTVSFEDQEMEQAKGRLHLAVPGSDGAPTAPAARPPRIRARLQRTTVGLSAPLLLRVRCDGGPCDLRAFASARTRVNVGFGPRTQTIRVAATAPLPAGRERTLKVEKPDDSNFVQPGTEQPVPIELTACTPDGSAARTIVLRPRVRALRAPAPTGRPRR